MNKIFVFVVFLLIFIPVSAFGQYRDFEESIQNEKIYMFVQVEVRNSGGSLAAYLETDRVIITDYENLSDNLDKTPDENRQIITIDGKELEVITGAGITRHQSDNVVSLTAISGDTGVVAFANHDGYPVKSGDEVKSIWTIIRPIS